MTETCSRRGMTDTRRHHLISVMVDFPDGLSLQGYTQTGVQDTRYLSINKARKARRNEHFDPPKLDDPPPTSELPRSSFVPLTTSAAAVAVTTQLSPIGRRPVVLWYYGRPCIKQGEGRLSTIPCVRLIGEGGDGSLLSPVWFYTAEGTALYRPLCSASSSRGGATLYRPLPVLGLI